jgi:hypothetical protein
MSAVPTFQQLVQEFFTHHLVEQRACRGARNHMSCNSNQISCHQTASSGQNHIKCQYLLDRQTGSTHRVSQF